MKVTSNRGNQEGIVSRRCLCLVLVAILTIFFANGLKAEPPKAPPGMVLIPAGTYLMGSNSKLAQENETPPHTVQVKSFYMDKTEVTNESFAAFVKATGFVTAAEKDLNAKDYPDAPPELLKAGSLLFAQTNGPVPLDDHMRWWKFVAGANWRKPLGPGSDIKGKDKHPVVCMTWEDALAYAKWAEKRLPTEAEWEWAARGGLAEKDYVWGDQLQPNGKHQANLWQGDFPARDTAEDGYAGTAPVKSFPANGYGLHDISGNVWEFTSDWYDPDYYLRSPKFPEGPTREEALDMKRRKRATSDTRQQLATIPHKVIRGGSFLCNNCYCLGYRPSARQITDTITATNHTGFRCVRSVDAR